MKKVEKEFECIAKFINESRNATIGLMNHASLSTYWTVGAYVSLRTKSGSWGDRTVDALCDYLKTRHPKLRGFSRRQIYNMIAFYDTYSSIEFKNIFDRLRLVPEEVMKKSLEEYCAFMKQEEVKRHRRRK